MPWQKFSEWKGEGSNEVDVKMDSSPGVKKEAKEEKKVETKEEIKAENKVEKKTETKKEMKNEKRDEKKSEIKEVKTSKGLKFGENEYPLLDFAKLSTTGEIETFTPEQGRELITNEMNSIAELTRILEQQGISCCLAAECALMHRKAHWKTLYVRQPNTSR
jgi:hypothetical protein